jgi:glycosyltransferase involved in cell wall biosynthesis
VWHTLWSETYSNPRYAELLPRLDDLFFAPIRQRAGRLGRLEGAVARRSPLVERRTLEWYRRAGVKLLLTPAPAQARVFPGSVVVDLDDPSGAQAERLALRDRRIRHVITTTTTSAAYVRECNSDVEISVIPQGVDLDRASRARGVELRRDILGSLSLPLDTVIVGYHAPIICVSSDEDFKRPEFRTFHVDGLLNAIRRLQAENLQFVSVLVGETSPTIAALASSDSRLVLPGYVDRDRLFDWVSTFDIGVYPRKVDFRGRQSVKLLEYLANGAAVVATRTAETEFLEETSTGYVASDDDAFLDRLRALIVDGDQRAALASRGRTVVAEHDWKRLAARYNEILATVTSDE